MARPVNREVSKITSIGLSKSGIKGAMAVAVLGTLASHVTNKVLKTIENLSDNRRRPQEAEEETETPAKK